MAVAFNYRAKERIRVDDPRYALFYEAHKNGQPIEYSCGPGKAMVQEVTMVFKPDKLLYAIFQFDWGMFTKELPIERRDDDA